MDTPHDYFRKPIFIINTGPTGSGKSLSISIIKIYFKLIINLKYCLLMI